MNSNTPNWEQAVERCAAQLRLEESVLRGLVAALRAIREALLLADVKKLQVALDAQRQQAVRSEAASAGRDELRGELAEVLGCAPAEATVTRLAAAAPPQAAQTLLELRKGVARLAAEVGRLTRGNAVLIHSQNRMLNELLSSLVGSAETGRYGCAGRAASSAPASLVETRC